MLALNHPTLNRKALSQYTGFSHSRKNALPAPQADALVFAAQGSSSVQADTTLLQKHVKALVTYPRHFDNPKGLEAAAKYIRQQWEEMGVTVREQAYEVDGKTYTNLIVSLNPTAQKRFIVGAHYDVCAYTTQAPSIYDLFDSKAGREKLMSPDFWIRRDDLPGADDNASGVAALLELTRILRQNQSALKVGVDLIAFTLEEPPNFNETVTMGSYVHAQSVKNQKKDIKGMIALDMIGYYNDKPAAQKYPFSALKWLYGSKGDFLAVVGTLGSFNWIRNIRNTLQKSFPAAVHKLAAPAFFESLQLSDHKNYVKLGINAAVVTDTGFFRNPNYHALSDTPETLNYDRIGSVTKGLYTLLTQQR